jgi:hypothetical protein
MIITNNAKAIITQVAFEVRLADDRAERGHIDIDQVLGCILERLAARAKQDVNMKTFLSTLAYIPDGEDIDPSVSWAKDRREPRAHVVTDRDEEQVVEHPEPGERIC